MSVSNSWSKRLACHEINDWETGRHAVLRMDEPVSPGH